MEKYTSKEGLELLNLFGISLPSNEINLFKNNFDKLYLSSEKYNDFIETVWRIYSEILPSEAYPNHKGESHSIMCSSRDDLFQENVINSGIYKKIKEGASIEDLLKNSNINPELNSKINSFF